MVLIHARRPTFVEALRDRGRRAVRAAGWPASALPPLVLPLLLLVLLPPALSPPALRASTPPEDSPAPAEVRLPLKDYLALADLAERADQARAAAKLQREAPLAEVVVQRIGVEITAREAGAPGAPVAPAAPAAGADDGATGGEARFAAELEVLVQGHPQEPLPLPLAGVAVAVEVVGVGAAGGGAPGTGGARAAGAAVATVDGGGAAGPGLFLVAPQPGRYTVRARSRARFASAGGESRVTLGRIVAPVAVLDVGLPADLAWECAGAVVVEDRVDGDRRRLRLSAGRGFEPVLVLRRRVAGDQAAELLVQDVVATFVQLRPEGLRRHDMVLYEVARGVLSDLVVDLPPGLEVERAGTDEGQVDPVIDGNRLVVHRQHRLQGSGYLVLTSRPAAGEGAVPLGLLAPAIAPRARYLAAAASVPGAVAPRPAASWTRVDLDDLPKALGEALAALDVTEAWRLAGQAPAAGLGLQVSVAPQAAVLETVVRRRLTTTLLTVDGTLLHRDSFELGQAGEALAIELPPGATLWSAAVDGEPVRPLLRGAALVVPLGGGGARVVEVVAVLDKAIAKGRSLLDLELARVQAPVIEHRWRLLLPESARYRFREGELRPAVVRFKGAAAVKAPAAAGSASTVTASELRPIPAGRDPWNLLQAAPGAPTDRVNVGGSMSGQQATYSGPAPSHGLNGHVGDPEGRPLPGVSVTVTTMAQLPPQVQVTNAAGDFAFPDLPPGTYELRAELAGFSTVSYPGLRLVNRGARAEIVLQPAIQDTITVGSESPLLDDKSVRTEATLRGAAGTTPAYRDFDSLAVLNELRQGLVGGVRPLPVAIPQAGKALLLTGVLPPARVTAELEVRSGSK